MTPRASTSSKFSATRTASSQVRVAPRRVSASSARRSCRRWKSSGSDRGTWRRRARSVPSRSPRHRSRSDAWNGAVSDRAAKPESHVVPSAAARLADRRAGRRDDRDGWWRRPHPGAHLLRHGHQGAIAISIVSVIATSSGSASAYVRDHITNLKVGMFLEMFTILGALAGAGITVSASEQPLYLLFGIVLLASWAALWAERGTPWKPVTHQDDLSRWLELEGSYDDRATGEHVVYRATRAYAGGPLMFGAGMVAGLLGIGAGALKVV